MRLNKKHAERISAAFSGIEPLVVESLEKQKSLLKDWAEKLKTPNNRRSYAHFGESYGGGWSKGQGKPYLSLNFQAPHKGYDTIYATLEFDSPSGELKLHVSGYKWVWNVGDMSHIQIFARLANEFFDEKNKEDIRQEKIKKLKTTSIVAKIAEIAKEDNFEYAFEENSRHVNLFVKLPGGNALGIQVPYGKFQEVMQQVRPLIQSVRELTEGGVTFSIKKAGWRHWISPKK